MDNIVMKAGLSNQACLNPYPGYKPEVPVYAVTDGTAPTIHRFYDTSPISPSGDLIALTELPFEDRLPVPGDKARVVVIHIKSGEKVYSSETAAWDTQVGAHVQWGRTDHELYFNRMSDEWRTYGVRCDIYSGEETSLTAPVYMISPDGLLSLSPDNDKLGLVQAGYGSVVPDLDSRRNLGAPKDDGVFITDLTSGETKLLVSLKQVRDAFPGTLAAFDNVPGGFYVFHVKWSPDQQRIMFLLRWVAANETARRTKNYLITCSKDGDDLHMPITHERWVGGHHPNWCPNSTDIVMNLRFPVGPRFLRRVAALVEKVARKAKIRGTSKMNALRFALFDYKGENLRKVAPSCLGSGHPTLSPDGRFLVSDAYVNEPVARPNGVVPIRWIDLNSGHSRDIVFIGCKPEFSGPNHEMRVDPHPAWDRSGKILAFNGCPKGTRQVFVADVTSLLP
jgi:Tol biopolymer transport system component